METAAQTTLRAVATPAWPLTLVGGGRLPRVELEYQTWGRPDALRSNAILVCHSFSADAHAAGVDPSASTDWRPWRIGRSGWWDDLIGPGRALDTDHFWIICSNVLGGSGGSTGPGSIDPATGLAWGERFPAITIGDIVAAQRRLLVQLGVQRLRLVVGGSLGGLQALTWAATGGERVDAVAVIAAAHQASSSGTGHFRSATQAIRAELARGGDGMRALRSAQAAAWRYSGPPASDPGAAPDPAEWPKTRFHPISHLRLADALIGFDLGAETETGGLAAAASRVRARTLVVGYHDDLLYPPGHGAALDAALRQAGADSSWIGLDGGFGHDSFLRNPLQLDPLLRWLLPGSHGSRQAI